MQQFCYLRSPGTRWHSDACPHVMCLEGATPAHLDVRAHRAGADADALFLIANTNQSIVFQKMIWTLRLRKSRRKLLGRRDQDSRSLNFT